MEGVEGEKVWQDVEDKQQSTDPLPERRLM
jgi:hypothetical protein